MGNRKKYTAKEKSAEGGSSTKCLLHKEKEGHSLIDTEQREADERAQHSTDHRPQTHTEIA